MLNTDLDAIATGPRSPQDEPILVDGKVKEMEITEVGEDSEE